MRITSLMLITLVGLAAADPLPAVDPGPSAPEATAPPASADSKRVFEAGEVALSDRGVAGTVSGGVKAWYESIFLHGDALTFKRSLYSISTKEIPEQVVLTPGAAGPADGRVVIDTTAATLPALGLRGRFTPQRVRIERKPADAATPALVAYLVQLDELGDFHGLLRNQKDEWVSHVGWADRADLDVIADVTSDGFANVRVRSLTMYGRAANADQPKRLAGLIRLLAPLDPTPPLDRIPDDRIDAHAQGRIVVLEIDGAGRLGLSRGVEFKVLKGNFMTMPGAQMSRPQLAPPSAQPRQSSESGRPSAK